LHDPRVDKKKLEERAEIVSKFVLEIINPIYESANESNFSSEFLTIFASLIQNGSMLFDHFHFPFEINRLEFSQFGSLNNMTKVRSSLILGMMIFVRVLVYLCILRPYLAFNGIEEKEINYKNLLTVGSVIYHLTLDIFRTSLKWRKNV